MSTLVLQSTLLLTTDTESNDVSVNVWDSISGAQIVALKGEVCSASTLNILNHATLVSAAANKPMLQIWNLTRQEQSAQRIFTSSFVTALTFTHDNAYCAGAIGNEIHIWQCCTGDLLSVLSGFHHTRILQLRFTNPLTHLISSDEDGHLAAWGVWTMLGLGCMSIARDHVDPVWTTRFAGANAVALSSQGQSPRSLLALASMNGHVGIFDVNSGSLHSRLVHEGRQFFCAIFNLIGTFLCCGADNGDVAILNLTGTSHEDASKSVLNMKFYGIHRDELGSLSPVQCLTVSETGSLLASGTKSGSVVVTSLRDFLPLAKLQLTGELTNLKLLSKPPWLDDATKIPTKTVIRPLKRNLQDRSASMTVSLEERTSLFDFDQMRFFEDESPVTEALSKNKETDEKRETSTALNSQDLKELVNLRTEVEELKQANRELYKRAVVGILS